MTTPCAWRDDVAQFLDGELSENRARELSDHLTACAECARHREELVQIFAALAPGPGELDEPSLADDVLRRVRVGQPAGQPEPGAAPWWRRWFMVPGATALAAAAAVLLLVVGPWSDEHSPVSNPRGEFVARGSAETKAEQWLAIWVYRAAASGSGYQEVGSNISTHDRLVFAYRDGQGSFGYLMILAVDRSGRVFWYHPAFENSSDDPSSLTIKRGRQELPEEIEHDLSEGPLRVFALFSRRPLRVSEVEQMVKELRRSQSDLTRLERLPVPEAGQISKLLRVEERR